MLEKKQNRMGAQALTFREQESTKLPDSKRPLMLKGNISRRDLRTIHEELLAGT